MWRTTCPYCSCGCTPSWACPLWDVQYYLERANFGQVEYVANQATTGRSLRVAEAIIPPIASKPWVAWFFTLALIRLPYSAKERFESKVYPDSNVLQTLASTCPREGRSFFNAGKRACWSYRVSEVWACSQAFLRCSRSRLYSQRHSSSILPIRVACLRVGYILYKKVLRTYCILAQNKLFIDL